MPESIPSEPSSLSVDSKEETITPKINSALDDVLIPLFIKLHPDSISHRRFGCRSALFYMLQILLSKLSYAAYDMHIKCNKFRKSY